MLQGQLNGRANGADFDVAKTSVRIWILINWTGTVGFVVQPSHYTAIVGTAPHGHGQDHSFPHSLRHAVGDASLCVGLAVKCTILIGHAIKTVECRLLDSVAILDVEALHLLEIAVVRSVDGDESGDDSELLSAVQLVTRSTTVKVFVPASVSVETTAIRIALAV